MAERRLCEERAGQLQNLGGAPQFLDLAFKPLDPLCLDRGDVSTKRPSTSRRLTHSSQVRSTQPIFGAIDSTAAHGEG